MHKLVNGKQIPMTEAEIAEIKESWRKAKLEKERTGYIQKRQHAYPPIGDQLDAILKQLNYMRMSEKVDLVEDLDIILGKYLQVKEDHPKPKE